MRYLPLAAAFLTFALSTATRAAEGPEALEGKPAPDFTLKTLDGKEAKLSGEKGNVVVVDFWATWCPPCRESLPHLNKVAADKAMADKGLKVMAVDARETTDIVQKFVTDNKYTFNVVLDAEGSAMKDYGVRGIPSTLVIGRDGVVKKAFVGYGGEESAKALDAAIESALNEPKPSK